jgi:acyl dehydratase
MFVVDTAADLSRHVGQGLGVSDWLTLSESDVLGFAEVTRDRHWVHSDPVRAARETEYGGVLAQGFLVLSLVTDLTNQCLTIRGAKRWLNYGLERVRFLAPVVPGDRLRLKLTLDSLQASPAGTRLGLNCELERDGATKPVMVAAWIVIVIEEDSHVG